MENVSITASECSKTHKTKGVRKKNTYIRFIQKFSFNFIKGVIKMINIRNIWLWLQIKYKNELDKNISIVNRN